MQFLPVGEEPTLVVLSFLSFGDVFKGLRCAASGWKLTAESDNLQRARDQGEYVLRGDARGIVHALATAFGTRRWEEADFTESHWVQGPPRRGVKVVPAPPNQLRLTFSLSTGTPHEDILKYEEGAIFSTLTNLEEFGHACRVRSGSFVEFCLPCSFRINRFRLGYGRCYSEHFTGWVFEGFHSLTQGWWVLFESPRGGAAIGREAQICVDVDAFVSDRFRIRLWGRNGVSCMHLRCFEMFGAVLPQDTSWSTACLDRTQPCRNVHVFPSGEDDASGSDSGDY